MLFGRTREEAPWSHTMPHDANQTGPGGDALKNAVNGLDVVLDVVRAEWRCMRTQARSNNRGLFGARVKKNFCNIALLL